MATLIEEFESKARQLVSGYKHLREIAAEACVERDRLRLRVGELERGAPAAHEHTKCKIETNEGWEFWIIPVLTESDRSGLSSNKLYNTRAAAIAAARLVAEELCWDIIEETEDGKC